MKEDGRKEGRRKDGRTDGLIAMMELETNDTRK